MKATNRDGLLDSRVHGLDVAVVEPKLVVIIIIVVV